MLTIEKRVKKVINEQFINYVESIKAEFGYNFEIKTGKESD